MGLNGLLIIGMLWTVSPGDSLTPVSAPEPLGVDREKHAEWSKDLDYEAEEEPESSEGWNLPSFSLDSDVAKVTLILVAAAILFFMLYRITQMSGRRNVKVKESAIEVRLQDAEDHLDQADPEKIFEACIAAGKWREAIRARYLQVLQMLMRSKKITWRKEKTNWDYLHEIEDDALSACFRVATQIYEIVWYGKHEISQQAFEEAVTHLNAVLDKLKQPEMA